MDADVAVVGAGIAGLRAADLLAARGARVVVLEARDRVGGRLWSRRIGRATFDVGGQWIGPHQRRAWTLTRELGLSTFDTFDDGDKLLFLGGRLRRYRGTIPSLDPLSLLELQLTLTRVERLARRISMEHPERSPRAAALDARTVAEWQAANVRSASVRAIVDAAIRVVFGVEARELSLLTFLFYVRGGGGLMKLVEIDGGAQQTRFADGAQRLAYGLADRVGDTIRLRCPVRAVEASAEGVRIRHDHGEVTARSAVLAIPPALARRIVFSPELPSSKRHRLARSPTGATTKHLLTYPHAFWRDAGLSGEIVCDGGPFTVAFDNTSAHGQQPALLAFSVAQPEREASALAPTERRRRLLDRLAECLGPRARTPDEHVELDWAREPWSRGCPVGLASTGTLSEHGDALRAPTGPVHWAGTETAREHHGFIEGALESAERVASELS